MKISIRYVEGCPHVDLAEERLRAVLAGRTDVTLSRELVASPVAAERLGFIGSPSVVVDGVDVFADEEAPSAMACRRYRTETGWQGAPSVIQLEGALGAHGNAAT